MKKDKTLGYDPLSWIKVTKEAESRQAGEAAKSEEKKTFESEATHIEVEKIKESPVVTTQPPRGYATTREDLFGSRGKTPSSTARTNGSSIVFIIAYAALLLGLTFFVYFSLSKRIDNMSLRISNIEKTLTFSEKR